MRKSISKRRAKLRCLGVCSDALAHYYRRMDVYDRAELKQILGLLYAIHIDDSFATSLELKALKP